MWPLLIKPSDFDDVVNDHVTAHRREVFEKRIAKMTNDLISKWSNDMACCSNGSGPTTSSVTLESLAELAKSIKPPPRDVFRYFGTMADFMAYARAAGFTFGADRIRLEDEYARYGLPMLPNIGGMLVVEIDKSLWMGWTHRDIEDARDGKLDYKVITGPNSRKPVNLPSPIFFD